jgi:hypothetical protein
MADIRTAMSACVCVALIGGSNSVVAWIFMALLALVFLPVLLWKQWPRPQLRKTQRGWELRSITSAKGPLRNTSQTALISRILIGVAVLIGMWLLLRSR